VTAAESPGPQSRGFFCAGIPQPAIPETRPVRVFLFLDLDMPQFSERSKQRLATCHADLQVLMAEVVKDFDCTIITGHRDRVTQNRMVEQGKSQVRWPNSRHNSEPSEAVDVAPYPIDWQDRERFHYFAGFVMGTAARLNAEGRMTHGLRWGGDWDMDTQVNDNNFDDLVHFELV
jgi:peptidoglycan L-alanyl-D-glutamate endopeptidase CwlK